MSNIELNPSRLTVYYTPTKLTIIAGGRHRRFSADSVGEDVLKEIYNRAKSYKANPSENNKDRLLEYFDPSYRIKVNAIVSQDIEGNMYLNDMPSIKLPKSVMNMIETYLEEGLELDPVLNLWKLALDNPSEQARKDLMIYIERFGVPVTDKGYMILYKSVSDKDPGVIEKLAYVVGQEFFELRRNRKDPRNYWVFELPENAMYYDSSPRFFVSEEPEAVCEIDISGEGSTYEVWWTESKDDEDGEPDGVFNTFAEALEELLDLGGSEFDASAAINIIDGLSKEVMLEPIGNLAEMFRDLVIDKQDLEPDEKDQQPVWVPYHRGTYGMEIRLGEPVTMPREECDPNINVECSHGLHVGSYEYVKNFHSHSGSILACLVNPRDIVALPEYDRSKIRVCRYMPYGIINVDEEGQWEEVEAPYWEEDFIDYEREELEARIEQLQEELEGKADSKKQAAMVEDLLKNAKNRLVDLTNN